MKTLRVTITINGDAMRAREGEMFRFRRPAAPLCCVVHLGGGGVKRRGEAWRGVAWLQLL
jgi:hypothetical protein